MESPIKYLMNISPICSNPHRFIGLQTGTYQVFSLTIDPRLGYKKQDTALTRWLSWRQHSPDTPFQVQPLLRAYTSNQ